MKPEKKNEILEAAVDLFSRKGYQQTNMSEIAEAVGLTKGGLYHHVDKKEDLLLSIHNEMTYAFSSLITSSIESAKTPKEKLTNWVAAHAHLMKNYAAHIKIFFDEIRHLERLEEFKYLRENRKGVFNILQGIIEEGISTGQFRQDINPFATTMLIFGMLNWFYRWYQPGGDLSMEDIVLTAQQFVCKGVVKH